MQSYLLHMSKHEGLTERVSLSKHDQRKVIKGRKQIWGLVGRSQSCKDDSVDPGETRNKNMPK